MGNVNPINVERGVLTRRLTVLQRNEWLEPLRGQGFRLCDKDWIQSTNQKEPSLLHLTNEMAVAVQYHRFIVLRFRDHALLSNSKTRGLDDSAALGQGDIPSGPSVSCASPPPPGQPQRRHYRLRGCGEVHWE